MRSVPRRTSFDPTRRICEPIAWSSVQRAALINAAKYVGSGHHKINPANFGLVRTNPRPTATVCDYKPVTKTIMLAQAIELLQTGVKKAMLSTAMAATGMPKYIWSVSDEGIPFEAKTNANTPWQYHGYPLDENDPMRKEVLKAWRIR
jgi:hypothetical protein